MTTTRRASRWRAAWTALTGAAGFVVGLLPHVLHHVAPILGTALVAGAGGTVAFGLLGLAATVPMLIRLRRRFESWWAPAIALAAFTAAFLVSTFVIGPSLDGGAGAAQTPPTAPPRAPSTAAPSATADPQDHAAHHSTPP